MGLFSKNKPEEIYDLLAQNITLNSLIYRTEVETDSVKKSSDVGEEMLYFLLHVLDRKALNLLGINKRDMVFDEVYKRAIYNYSKAVFKKETPQETVARFSIQMLDKLNERQSIYGKCKSFVGKTVGKGTMVFALSYFIHKALGKTNRNDVDSILIGVKDVTKNDLNDFPDWESTLKLAIYVGTAIKKINFPKLLKKLK